MSAPLRVTHVVLSLDFGGLERVVLSLVQEAGELSQIPSVLCLERPGSLAPQVEALGVPVVCVNKLPGLKWNTIDRVQESFQHLRPDVVHTHQIGALLYAGPAARRERLAGVVHTEHTNVASRKAKTWARRLRTGLMRRYAGRFADKFCGVSKDGLADAAAFRRVPKRKLIHVPNGIDTDTFAIAESDRDLIRHDLGISDIAPVIGTVGRLAPVKQQDVLIRAFASMIPDFPTARLLLVGDGPLQSELKALTSSLGVSSQVHFAGYQSKPERFLAAMDIFVLPSQAEAMPLVIPEAWAAGRPVVASRVGGIPEMLDDGKTGFLVPGGDADCLAHRLKQLVANPQLAHELGRAGQQLARDKYDVSVMTTTYDRIYRELLTQKKVGLQACGS